MSDVDTTDAERGWVEIPSLLSRQECTHIIDDCQRICADPSDRHQRDKPVAGTIHLEELDARVALVGEMLGRSKLTTAVASWFDVDAAPQPMQVSLRAPGPGFGGQDLHRDAMEGPPLPIPQVVTAIVALTDFTDRNGATRIIPRSHQSTMPVASFRGRRRSDDEVALIGPAGTAFVFNGHAIHGGGQNDSAEHRYALQIVWRVAR